MILNRIKRVASDIEKFCETPFYLIDFDQILKKYQSIISAWKKYFPRFTLAYSYKTNALRSITQSLCQHNAAAEVVSGTELLWALEDGFLPEKILFDGPVKKTDEILLALKNKINIQVDSIDELEKIHYLCQHNKINPSLSLRLSTLCGSGSVSRFGLLPDEYYEAARFIKKSNYSLVGLHMHIGSNINQPEFYINAIERNHQIIRYHLDQFCKKMRLDIGGGWPAQSLGKDILLTDHEIFAEKINRSLKDLHLPLEDIEVVIEPGRSLVEDYGFLVTKVYSIKKRDERCILIVDAGLNLIRSMHTWYHPIHFLFPESKSDLDSVLCDVYGSNCFESDLIAKNLMISSKITIGDVFLIGSCGGYDIPSANIWTRPAPPIFIYMNGNISIARRQQTVNEIRAAQFNFSEVSYVS